MKICWDNLEKLRYSKKTGKWYNGHNIYYYIESCRNCADPYLTCSHINSKNKHGEYCSKSCANFGEEHPQYIDGRSSDKRRKYIYGKKWAEENPEKTRDYKRKWAKENPAKCAKKRAKYRAKKLNQTPDDADDRVITWYYTMAKQMSDRIGQQGFYHVDHIIPLSKDGLHHEDNLQILTAHQNMSKGNSIWS